MGDLLTKQVNYSRRCMVVGIAIVVSSVQSAYAGPTSFETGIPTPCGLPAAGTEMNLLDSGRGIRKIAETTWWKDNKKPSSTSIFEFNEAGQPTARNSVETATGYESWHRFEWKSGRLVAYESGNYDPDSQTQSMDRWEYGDTSDGRRFLLSRYVAKEKTAKRKAPQSFHVRDETLLFEVKLPDGDTQCFTISTESADGYINRTGSDGFFRQQELIKLRYGRPANLAAAHDEMFYQASQGTTVYPTDLRRGRIGRWERNADIPKGYRMFGRFKDGVMEEYLLVNDKNYLAEAGKASSNGERMPEHKYEYDYDERGNWKTARQKRYENGSWHVVFRHVRQNVYFDSSNRRSTADSK